MVVVIVLLGLAMVFFVTRLANPSNNVAGTDAPYQNEDYTAPPPDANPPDIVIPDTKADAKTLLENNALYQQTAPRPIRCDLSIISPTEATRDELQQHFDQLTACLMKQWAGVLESAGYVAVRPSVTIYDDTVQTGCGKVESGNAFYCPADQQVYVASDVLNVVPPELAKARFTFDAVVAHEFGHAIQARVGILASSSWLESEASKSEALALSRRAELQADCFSGVYLGGVAQSLQMTQKDFADLKALYTAIGDDTLSGKPNKVGNHGRSTSRAYWGELGIQANPPRLSLCNTWIAPDDQVR